jgi:hypothetical protein
MPPAADISEALAGMEEGVGVSGGVCLGNYAFAHGI